MNDKVKKLREKLLQMGEGEFQNLLDEGKEMTNHDWRKRISQWQKTDFLLFKPELIHELAKPFINAYEMIKFEGENQDQIRSAGGYIMNHKVERPEWFEDIEKNSKEDLDECLKIARNYNDYNEFITSEKRIYQRIFWLVGTDEMKRIFRSWGWEFIAFEYTDDNIYDALSQYKDTRELRKSKIHKKLLYKMGKDKGVQFPKSYALYLKMQIKGDKIVRSKRGNYEQRDPLIQQYTLDGKLLGEFTWQQITEDMGFNRSTITGCLKGINGQKTAKGYIWKYKE